MPVLASRLSDSLRIAAWNRLGCDIHPDAYIDGSARIDGTTVRVGAAFIAAWGDVIVGANAILGSAPMRS